MDVNMRRIDYTEEYVVARLADNGEEMEINNIVLNVLKNIGTGFIMAGLFDIMVFDHRGIDVDESANYPVDSTHAGGMRYVPIETVMSFYGYNNGNSPFRMVDLKFLDIPSLPELQTGYNTGGTWRDIFSDRVSLMIDQLYQVYYSTGLPSDKSWLVENMTPAEFQMTQPGTIHHALYVKDVVMSILLKLINTILSEVFFNKTEDRITSCCNVLFEMEEHSGMMLSFTNVIYSSVHMD